MIEEFTNCVEMRVNRVLAVVSPFGGGRRSHVGLVCFKLRILYVVKRPILAHEVLKSAQIRHLNAEGWLRLVFIGKVPYSVSQCDFGRFLVQTIAYVHLTLGKFLLGICPGPVLL